MSWEEQIAPINDWVLLRPMDAFKSQGGLALPEGYADDAHGDDDDHIRTKNQLCLAVVIAIGNGWKWSGTLRTPLDVGVGDKVMYNRADAKRVDGSEPLLVLVRHHCIYMIVEGSVRQVVGGLVTG